MSRRMLGLIGVICLATGAIAPRSAGQADRHEFHLEQILGTSMDLSVVAASPADAERALTAARSEVERLAHILSTWSATSEIRRLPAGEAVAVSDDLRTVLVAAEQMRQQTRGAFNPLVGGLVSAWRQAEKAGTSPDGVEVAGLARHIQRPAYREAAGGQIVVADPQLLAIDGIAKGYIIDRALAAAAATPGVRGVMLDIGGDLAVAGSADPAGGAAWAVAIADPGHPAENAPPAARLLLQNQAVASSGAYARPVVIAGEQYSHIIDPRSGRAVDAGRAATVVAPDAMTADALATALCVLDPRQGVAIAEQMPGVAAMVWAEGQSTATRNWSDPMTTVASAPEPDSEGDAVGAAAQNVQIEMVLSGSGNRPKKPYVVVWIADAAGDPVRTLEVWGRERKYQKDLRTWWREAGSRLHDVDAVTRASRRAGAYELTWDGVNDAGEPVPAGHYVVHLEVAREDAGRWDAQVPVVLGPDPSEATTDGSGDIVRLTVRTAPDKGGDGSRP